MNNLSIIVQLRRGTQPNSYELRKKEQIFFDFFVKLIGMVVGMFSAQVLGRFMTEQVEMGYSFTDSTEDVTSLASV
jgi:hypothetical protein